MKFKGIESLKHYIKTSMADSLKKSKSQEGFVNYYKGYSDACKQMLLLMEKYEDSMMKGDSE